MSRERIVFAKAGTGLNEDVCLMFGVPAGHGLICMDEGTGRRALIQVIAERLSAIGIPVFVSDTKGLMTGIIKPGADTDEIRTRTSALHIENTYRYRGYPAEFYDPAGEKGINFRITATELGPCLMAIGMGLKGTRTEVLKLAYRIADKEGLLLIDTKDLKAMLGYLSENSTELETQYGRISGTTVNAIIRNISSCEAEGADKYIGEPAIDVGDFFRTSEDGRGIISILDLSCTSLNDAARASFIIYILSEIMEYVSQDASCRTMAFMIDDAGRLFKKMTAELTEKLADVLDVLSARGVSVYFACDEPGDIPEKIMPLLKQRIVHVPPAYTPEDKRRVKKTAGILRADPEIDTALMLSGLGTYEAAVSLTDAEGIPGTARRVSLLPPESHMQGLSAAERREAVTGSPLYEKYREMEDRDSCYEFMQRLNKEKLLEAEELKEKALKEREERNALKEQEKEETALKKKAADEEKALIKAEEKAKKEEAKETAEKSRNVKKAVKSVLSTTAGTIGREAGKNIGSDLGGDFGKTLGGNIGASLGRNILGTLFKI